MQSFRVTQIYGNNETRQSVVNMCQVKFANNLGVVLNDNRQEIEGLIAIELIFSESLAIVIKWSGDWNSFCEWYESLHHH